MPCGYILFGLFTKTQAGYFKRNSLLLNKAVLLEYNHCFIHYAFHPTTLKNSKKGSFVKIHATLNRDDESINLTSLKPKNNTISCRLGKF